MLMFSYTFITIIIRRPDVGTSGTGIEYFTGMFSPVHSTNAGAPTTPLHTTMLAQNLPQSATYIDGQHLQQQHHSSAHQSSQPQPLAKATCPSQAIQMGADQLLELFMYERATMTQKYEENINMLRTRFFKFKAYAEAELQASEKKRKDALEILSRENQELKTALDNAGLTIMNGEIRRKDGAELPSTI